MKTKAPDRVEIRIPRRAEFVRVARMAACALASQLDFTYDIVKDLELAVGEACANAVEHVADETADEIIVRFLIDPNQLMIEVIDQGQGFDPEAAEPGAQGEWDEGGLGLMVIRELMDELEVTCDSDSGTCVRMVKHRP